VEIILTNRAIKTTLYIRILYLTDHHAMKMYGGAEVELHALTSAPDGVLYTRKHGILIHGVVLS
jgi:hypothetical protein